MEISPQNTISLITRVKDKFIGYAVVTPTSDGADIEYVVERRGDDAAQRKQALTAALESAIASAETAGAAMHLAVLTHSIRYELVQIGQRFGPVHVLLCSQIDTQHSAVVEAGRTLTQMLGERRDELEASEPTAPAVPSKRRPIVVATDGSFDRLHGGASYAWVADSGVHGYGASRARTPLGAELAAIDAALLRVKGSLEILTDSQEAIAAIHSAPLRKPLTSTEVTAVSRIQAALRKRKAVTFTWVKGHSGVPLNDAADRLARLCRQATDFGTPVQSVRHIADGIVSGLAEAA